MEIRATDPPLPTRIRKAPVKIPNAPPGFASGAISYPGQPGEIKVADALRRKVTTARTFVRTILPNTGKLPLRISTPN